MKRLYTQICQVDTVYSLFLYLILFPRNIESTFFFFGSGIPDIVKEQFKGHSFIIKKTGPGFNHNAFLNMRSSALSTIELARYLCYTVKKADFALVLY